MKSRLLKSGLLFLVAVFVTIATINYFSITKNRNSNSQKNVTKTEENLVKVEKLEVQSNKNAICNQVKNQYRKYNNVVSKIETLTNSDKPSSETENLRLKHQEFLEKHLFKKEFLMSKSERKAEGLPPNKYFEQDWALTANPELGRPTGENLSKIREELEKNRQQALLNRTPGDGADNPWVERGPNNVGGRTKAIIFDPTDSTNKTVIAGGISGGLWKNTDITGTTAWTKMSLPENINVQNITVDPLNSSTW